MAKLQTIEVIKYAAFETLHSGYTKRSENQKVACTADKIMDMIIGAEISEDELNDINDRIRAWHKYIDDPKQDGEYFESVRSAIANPTVDEIKIGLIASSFSSFDKHTAFEKLNEKEKESEFLGQEGDTITFDITDHKLVKSGSSKFGNGGKWFLYKIYNGCNVIIYFADHKCEFEFEHSTKATAVISKLTTYNDVKQTNVSKLKFM